MTETSRIDKFDVVVTAYPKLRRVEVTCVPSCERAKVLTALRGILDAEVRDVGAAFELVVRGDGALTRHVAISVRNALRSAGIELAK